MFSSVVGLAPASGSNEPAVAAAIPDGSVVRPGTRQCTNRASAAVAAAAKNKFPTMLQIKQAVGNIHKQLVTTQRVVNEHTNLFNENDKKLFVHDQKFADLDQKFAAVDQRLASLEQHTHDAGMGSENERFIRGELGKRGRGCFIDQSAADDLLKSNRFKSLRGLKYVASRARIPYAKDLK